MRAFWVKTKQRSYKAIRNLAKMVIKRRYRFGFGTCNINVSGLQNQFPPSLEILHCPPRPPGGLAASGHPRPPHEQREHPCNRSMPSATGERWRRLRGSPEEHPFPVPRPLSHLRKPWRSMPLGQSPNFQGLEEHTCSNQKIRLHKKCRDPKAYSHDIVISVTSNTVLRSPPL